MKKGKGWAILLALAFLAHYAVLVSDAVRVRAAKTHNREGHTGYCYWQYWYLMTPGGAAQRKGDLGIFGSIEGILSCLNLLLLNYVYKCYKYVFSVCTCLGRAQKLSDLTQLRYCNACACAIALPSKSVKKESRWDFIRGGTLFLKAPTSYGAYESMFDGGASLGGFWAYPAKLPCSSEVSCRCA